MRYGQHKRDGTALLGGGKIGYRKSVGIPSDFYRTLDSTAWRGETPPYDASESEVDY